MYSSFLPTGPVIYTHPFLDGDKIISIGCIIIIDKSGNSNSDHRGDQRIIQALKKYDQYRK
jgi:hypothetical protein